MPQIIWILFGISGHSVARQHKTSFRPAHQHLNFPQHDFVFVEIRTLIHIQKIQFLHYQISMIFNAMLGR